MPILGFKDIEFGKADGQTECTYHPELLLYGFLDAYKYIYRILNDYKFLILGPKGSGKSAIAGRLKLEAERTRDLYVGIHTLEKFPYGMFKKMMPTDESSEILFPVQWEFFLLIALFDSLCKDDDIKFRGKYKDLQKGLAELGIFPGKSLVEMTKTVSKKEFKINLCNYVQGGTYSERQKINIGIDILIKNLDEVCFSSETQSKHFIILDKLDNVLIKKDTQFESLAALILAADAINRKARETACKAKIIILCRNDLYDQLDNPNLNKIKRDFAIELDWYQDTRDIYSTNLVRLINLRAKIALKRDDVDVFRDFLPEEIWSDQTAKKLLENTRFRPRDIIELLNTIKDNTNGDKPTVEVIKNSLRLYSSNYFLAEIADEVVGSISKDEFKLIIALIGRNSKRFFMREDLIFKMGADKRYNNFPLDKALEALFTCSAIGNFRKKENGDVRYYFKYINKSAIYDPDSGIILHLGLTKALNI